MRFPTISLAVLTLFLSACGGSAAGLTSTDLPGSDVEPLPPIEVQIDGVIADTTRDGVAAGPTTGGTWITITGVGFLAGSPVEVRIGDAEAGAVDVQSDTRIKAKTPPSPSGGATTESVSVQVGGVGDEYQDGFKYCVNWIHWARTPEGATYTRLTSLDPTTGYSQTSSVFGVVIEALATSDDGRLHAVGQDSFGDTLFVFEVEHDVLEGNVAVHNTQRVEFVGSNAEGSPVITGMDFYGDSLHVLLGDVERSVRSLDPVTGDLPVRGAAPTFAPGRGEGLAIDAGGVRSIAPDMWGLTTPASLYLGHVKEAGIGTPIDLREDPDHGVGLGDYLSALAYVGGSLHGVVASVSDSKTRLFRIDVNDGSMEFMWNLPDNTDALAADFR